jgi:hypothetical protein
VIDWNNLDLEEDSECYRQWMSSKDKPDYNRGKEGLK